jgi:hypothetical protein
MGANACVELLDPRRQPSVNPGRRRFQITERNLRFEALPQSRAVIEKLIVATLSLFCVIVSFSHEGFAKLLLHSTRRPECA